VDVRDVAWLHVAAMKSEVAAGNRYPAASAQAYGMADLARALKEAGYDKASDRIAPHFLIKVAGWFSKDARGMVPLLGVRLDCDNHSTVDDLAWKPTTLNQTMADAGASVSASLGLSA